MEKIVLFGFAHALVSLAGILLIAFAGKPRFMTMRGLAGLVLVSVGFGMMISKLVLT